MTTVPTVIPVKRSLSVRLRCRKCGAMFSRSFKAIHVSGPGNRDAEGNQKPIEAVQADVIEDCQQQAYKAKLAGAYCKTCSNSERKGK